MAQNPPYQHITLLIFGQEVRLGVNYSLWRALNGGILGKYKASISMGSLGIHRDRENPGKLHELYTVLEYLGVEDL